MDKQNFFITVSLCAIIPFVYTVEPLIKDTLKSGQPPYNGQTVHPLPIHSKKGQPLNNGQTVHPLPIHSKKGQPLNNGQTVHPLPIHSKKGQPLNNGQTVHPLPIHSKKGQPLNNGQTVHPLPIHSKKGQPLNNGQLSSPVVGVSFFLCVEGERMEPHGGVVIGHHSQVEIGKLERKWKLVQHLRTCHKQQKNREEKKYFSILTRKNNYLCF